LRAQHSFAPREIGAMPWKQCHGASHARDDAECSRGEPHAHVLPKLAGWAKVAQLRVKLISGLIEPLVHWHCRLLGAPPAPGQTLGRSGPDAQFLGLHPSGSARCCALQIAHAPLLPRPSCRSQIASIGPERKLPLGSIDLAEGLVPNSRPMSLE